MQRQSASSMVVLGCLIFPRLVLDMAATSLVNIMTILRLGRIMVLVCPVSAGERYGTTDNETLAAEIRQSAETAEDVTGKTRHVCARGRPWKAGVG